MKRIGCATLAIMAMLALSGTASAAPRVSLSIGADYSTGDFGQPSDTTVYSVPMAARLTNGDWSFRISVPYLQIDGNADVADVTDAGADGGAAGGATGTIVRSGTVRGIGDTTLSVTKSFTDLGPQGMYVDLTGRVRFSTGDEDKGLGVGATDYGAGAELGVSRHGNGAYVNVVRRFLGDRAGFERQDGWQATVGGWLRAGERTTVGASYFWRESTFKGGEEPSELGAYVSYRMNENLRVAVNASGGLSDASPDASVGLRLTWRSTARH